MAYEVINADSAHEALKKSAYQIGGLAVVKSQTTYANSDGTFTITMETRPLSAYEDAFFIDKIWDKSKGCLKEKTNEPK